MNINFHYIGLAGKSSNKLAFITYNFIYKILINKGYKLIIEKNIVKKLKLKNVEIGNLNNIGEKAQLAIIIGGDGNMLRAARILSFYDIKVIGINCGNLGFLNEIDPKKIKKQIFDILKGKYYFENRFLLEVKIKKNIYTYRKETAINEIIFHSSKVAHMIEFEVYIDKKFAFSQRSNGLIVSTPTGSTAYSLSAGGPILFPSLEAIVLVPMFPHTLSSRPLVISNKSIVHLVFSDKKNLEISCDSQIIIPIDNYDNIVIKKSKNYLNLIHLLKYNYFNSLTSKLGWSNKLF